jgi:hypothetical protein
LETVGSLLKRHSKKISKLRNSRRNTWIDSNFFTNTEANTSSNVISNDMPKILNIQHCTFNFKILCRQVKPTNKEHNRNVPKQQSEVVQIQYYIYYTSKLVMNVLICSFNKDVTFINVIPFSFSWVKFIPKPAKAKWTLCVVVLVYISWHHDGL